MTRPRAFICGCATVIAAVFAVPAGGLAADPQPFEGIYEGKAKGVAAKVEVSSKLRATLRYRLKTECGRAAGRIDLGLARNGRLAGSSGGKDETSARLKVSADGMRLSGAIAQTDRGEGRDCRSRRKVETKLARTDAFVPALAEGRYSGAGELGTPISFDVAYDPSAAAARVENLAVDVAADCYDEQTAGDEFPMVVHIAGLSGEIDRDGEVYVEYVPDDDYTEYIAEGRIADGEARLDVYVSGLFDAEGNPDGAGAFVCDSWGEIFIARRG